MIGAEVLIENWPILWVIAAVVFGIIEGVTMGLTTIWFCGGAVAAALVAMIGAPVGVQFALFFIVSIVLLYFTRPLAQKKLNMKVEKTNSDALIGHVGFVTIPIPAFSTGQVKIQGKEWTAVAWDQERPIDVDTKVLVRSIEGVKLVVEPSAEEIKQPQ